MMLAGFLKKFFGDGSDGAFNSTADTTWTVATPDEDSVVKFFTSFHLNNGHTLTVSDRCRGVFIYCTGDVTIDGIINMDYKAPVAPVDSTVPPCFPITVRDGLFHPGQGMGDSYRSVLVLPLGGAGGKGGDGGSVSQTRNGGRGGKGSMPSWWGGGRGGGGGGGAARGGVTNIGNGGAGGDADYSTPSGTGGAGADVECWSTVNDWATGVTGGCGAGGGGGASWEGSLLGSSIERHMTAGSGGSGAGAGGGGGIGASTLETTDSKRIGYSGTSTTNHYGGGAVYIIAQGNIVIGSHGFIAARGANGAKGAAGRLAKGHFARPAMAGGGGGGGGAGGGVICLLYGGTYTNNNLPASNSLQVTGGTGGQGGNCAIYDENDFVDVDRINSANNGFPGGSGCDGLIVIRSIER